MKVLLKSNEPLQEAVKRYERFTHDDRARAAYEARQKFLHDQASFVAAAREEGLAKGEEIGIAKGEEIGAERGKREAAVEMARKLLSRGMTPEEVADVTGLSAEEIASLRA